MTFEGPFAGATGRREPDPVPRAFRAPRLRGVARAGAARARGPRTPPATRTSPPERSRTLGHGAAVPRGRARRARGLRDERQPLGARRARAPSRALRRRIREAARADRAYTQRGQRRPAAAGGASSRRRSRRAGTASARWDAAPTNLAPAPLDKDAHPRAVDLPPGAAPPPRHGPNAVRRSPTRRRETKADRRLLIPRRETWATLRPPSRRREPRPSPGRRPRAARRGPSLGGQPDAASRGTSLGCGPAPRTGGPPPAAGSAPRNGDRRRPPTTSDRCGGSAPGPQTRCPGPAGVRGPPITRHRAAGSRARCPSADRPTGTDEADRAGDLAAGTQAGPPRRSPPPRSVSRRCRPRDALTGGARADRVPGPRPAHGARRGPRPGLGRRARVGRRSGSSTVRPAGPLGRRCASGARPRGSRSTGASRRSPTPARRRRPRAAQRRQRPAAGPERAGRRRRGDRRRRDLDGELGRRDDPRASARTAGGGSCRSVRGRSRSPPTSAAWSPPTPAARSSASTPARAAPRGPPVTVGGAPSRHRAAGRPRVDRRRAGRHRAGRRAPLRASSARRSWSAAPPWRSPRTARGVYVLCRGDRTLVRLDAADGAVRERRTWTTPQPPWPSIRGTSGSPREITR